ncbi:MAG: tetratricopeptide repeat protein [Treponema sp.]|nr:tetratricopeptide repeat protein [Treponema sp.]
MKIPAFFAVLFFFILTACGNREAVRTTPPEIPLGSGGEGPPAESAGRPAGTADEIRRLTEAGVPSSLLRSVELIRARNLEATEFGRVMNGVNAALLRALYSDLRPPLPAVDLPQSHAYARILREAGQDGYTPQPDSADYLQCVLPFLALTAETAKERLEAALPDLRRAGGLNPSSVLAPYFTGVVYERTGNFAEAQKAYAKAWELSSECYPAALGLIRTLDRSGRKEEARRMLSDLVISYPDNMGIKRQLAVFYYENRDWSRAEAAIAEILQQNSRDGEFLLMRAHVLVEEGQALQAQAPLDLYASGNTANNRLYLFLRARVQMEAYRNRDAALNYIRSMLRLSSVDDEATVYAARLLMESGRSEDQSEGRELLSRLLRAPSPSLAVTSLALKDAVRRENWREAQGRLARLLDERRSFEDLLDAYTVERGLGNSARALAYARELYERDLSSDEGIIAYVSALVDTGRQEEAARMIESRLSGAAGGTVKSRYYYLRSRTRTGEEAVMSDLRSSLFEDPRNVGALTAMFEIYHRRRDERRAVYYLKQALALAPDNPQLRRYEREYSGALN